MNNFCHLIIKLYSPREYKPQRGQWAITVFKLNVSFSHFDIYSPLKCQLHVEENMASKQFE